MIHAASKAIQLESKIIEHKCINAIRFWQTNNIFGKKKLQRRNLIALPMAFIDLRLWSSTLCILTL